MNDCQKEYRESLLFYMERINVAIPVALDLLEKAKEINKFALMGKRPRSVLAGAVYLASVLMRIPVRQTDLAYFSGLVEVTVRKRYIQLAELLGAEFRRDIRGYRIPASISLGTMVSTGVGPTCLRAKH
jgi:hypothetical protein